MQTDINQKGYTTPTTNKNNENQGSHTKKIRVNWVDTAKGLGIFLVFYGHIIQSFYLTGTSFALIQVKFIYAFHMPLFFFLSGFFWKKPDNTLDRLRKLSSSRLIPVIFFSALLLPFWAIRLIRGNINAAQLMQTFIDYIYGIPGLNYVTWFLVCLFSCEVLATLIFPLLKTRKRAFLFGVLSLLGGLLIGQNLETFMGISGLRKDLWFIHQGIVALGLYSMGYAIFPWLSQWLDRKRAKFVIFVSFSVLLLSFNLNLAGTNFVVLMTSSDYGNNLLFIISAISGIAFIISLSLFLQGALFVSKIGEKALYFLGLNGFFTHFANPIIAKMPLNSSWLMLTVSCLIITLISMLVCIPFISVASKYLPYPLGKGSTWIPKA